MACVTIPERLARTSVAWEGERARAWLAALPGIVTDVADAWDLELGTPYEPGGNISWVAPVLRRPDGLRAVLKVPLPHPESAPEAVALAGWSGRGAVRLHAHDVERSALLLERCEPGLGLVDEGGTLDAVRAGASVGARLHAVAPPAGLPSLADVLGKWADELAARLDVVPPDDPGLGRLALDTMRTRPRGCTTTVLLHGDLNPTNILSSAREPWLAIDPKPMVGDPAYDGPRLVLQPDPARTPDPGGTVAGRVDVVCDVMGVDREGLLLWCVVNAVDMGAWASSHGDAATARRCAAQLPLVAGLLT